MRAVPARHHDAVVAEEDTEAITAASPEKKVTVKIMDRVSVSGARRNDNLDLETAASYG